MANKSNSNEFVSKSDIESSAIESGESGSEKNTRPKAHNDKGKRHRGDSPRSSTGQSSGGLSRERSRSSSGSDRTGDRSISDSGSSGSESSESDEEPPAPESRPPTIPRPPFQPPKYFKAVKASSKSISKQFSPSNLQGKEIWHISTPASFPLHLVKELSRAKIQSGEAILFHKGSEYALFADESNGAARRLFVPRNGGTEYVPAKLPISQSLVVQRKLILPDHCGGRDAEASQGTTAKPPPKPVREQPKNLKMRFIPIGCRAVGSKAFGWDSEGEEEPVKTKAPKFRFPKGHERASLERKRHGERDAGSTQEKVPREKKRHGEQDTGSSQEKGPREKKRHGERDAGSSQEKKRRRVEKSSIP